MTAVPTEIASIDESTACVETNAHITRIAQFTAPWCVRCAPFTEKMQTLCERFKFKWIQVDTSLDREIIEECDICKLPAVIVYNGDSEETHQGITPEELERIVENACASASFATDVDF